MTELAQALKTKILVPEGIYFEGDCVKIVGESESGSFGILPNHVDFVTSLRPGILVLTHSDNREFFFATDQGILVKRDRRVMISTSMAVRGQLGTLRQALLDKQAAQASQEEEARNAIDRLEATLVRQIMDWDGASRG